MSCKIHVDNQLYLVEMSDFLPSDIPVNPWNRVNKMTKNTDPLLGT